MMFEFRVAVRVLSEIRIILFQCMSVRAILCMCYCVIVRLEKSETIVGLILE
jgi:hypothetical protein